MKSSKWPSLILVLLLFTGCLTSKEAIFEKDQVVQDPNFEGDYQNLMQNGSELPGYWHIRKSGDFPDRYEVAIFEGSAFQSFIGTLFKINDTVYLDLVPWQENSIDRWPSVGPSQTEMLHAALFSPRHLIWRIQIKKDQIKYFTSTRRGVYNITQKAPELSNGSRASGESAIILLPTDKKAAQEYLTRFSKDKEYFDCEGTFKKITREKVQKIMGHDSHSESE